MVFSLFRKNPEKMPERQPARPRPGAEEPAPPEAPVAGAPVEHDFTDSQFGEGGLAAIEVEHDIDPIRADIEQAAVLFANGQDSAARAVLEQSARAHAGPRSEPLWRMLLDLVQLTGDRAAFEHLGVEFARACETSPPAWRAAEMAAPGHDSGNAEIVLQGVVTGADAPEISSLKAAIAAGRALRLDFGRLAGCDEQAAGALCDLMRLARRQGVSVEVEGCEGLMARLESRLSVGQPESPRSWLLLLELYQRQGRQEAFEDKAVDYAVTFEVSPPSWESVAPVARKARAAAPAASDDALFLSGELKNCRFAELTDFVAGHNPAILDFSRVRRLDFFSAGLLRNTLEPFKGQGREIVIRNPHHLVAELLAIVGLDGIARIIVTKS